RQLANSKIESVYFIIPNEQIDIEVLLSDMDPEKIEFHIEMKFLSFNYIEKLQNFTLQNKIKIYLYVDIVGNLTQDGNWYFNLEKDFRILHKIVSTPLSFKSV